MTETQRERGGRDIIIETGKSREREEERHNYRDREEQTERGREMLYSQTDHTC